MTKTKGAHDDVRLRRLVIRDYRGIEEREIDVDPAGMIAAGFCATGKTSLLRAVQSALSARDVHADAVRIGADRSEIFVDVGSLHVRRTTKATGGTTLDVRDAVTQAKIAKPQSVLDELFGPLTDPLELMALSPKERRARVLAAIPISVETSEVVSAAPSLAGAFSVRDGEHGLDAVKRAHGEVYARRATANKIAEEASEKERAAARSLEGRADPEAAVETGDARVALDAAKAKLVELQTKTKAVADYEMRTSDARAKIADLRDRATRSRPAEAVDRFDGDIAEAAKAVRDAEGEVDRLRAAIAEAEAIAVRARGIVDVLFTAKRHTTTAIDEARRLEEQATSIEQTIGATAPDPIDQAAIDAADARVTKSTTDLVYAEEADKTFELQGVHEKAIEATKVARVLAEALDRDVRALADDLPRKLLARTKSIEGLTLLDDDVALDGVASSKLCGLESLRFCVNVAKRMNHAAKLLIVDGLERLDAEGLAEFIATATADGWQVLASRVENHDLTLTPIGGVK